MATTQISDVVVPEVFTPYVQQLTMEKSRLVQSGAIATSGLINQLLAGGGLTFNVPSFRDLVNEDENISTDEDYGVNDSTPKKTGTSKEVAVRLSRNQSWSSTDLAAALAGEDPMESIASRVAYYWTRRMQAAFVATINGIFADNDAAPAGTEHVQGDLTNDVSGSSYSVGVTNFSAEAFLDALVTMGDGQEDLTMVMMHSIVYNRAQKSNLIDFIPDSTGRVQIPTFLGREVVVDDGVPNTNGVYDTWLFGPGVVQMGTGAPKTPTEIERKPEAGNGGGLEILFNRVQWCMHPSGHAYVGTAPNGGPSNAATTNNLAAAASWQRVYPERKQIKIARLKTREF